MINWMQKHKKYLIPTIWVSTIAFVGAGFVGWGAYDMNKDRSTSVAKVGKTPVTYKEFQQKYNTLYNYFNTISNGQMTQEQASKMNLEQAALIESIQDTMRLNFAKDLGIGVNEQEIAKYLISMPDFQRDGKFDEALYKSTIQRLGMKPVDFENSLKKDVIINKLNSALKLPATKNDIDALAASFFMQDRLSLDVLEINFNDVNITEAELKEFWQKSKDDYKTATSYELETYFVAPQKEVDSAGLRDFWERNKDLYRDSDDKVKEFEDAKEDATRDFKLELGRRAALITHNSLKKGELNATEKLTVSEDEKNFPFEEIKGAKVGEFIKPFEYNDGYLIVKINKIIPPQTMKFEQARLLATPVFKDIKAKAELESLAKKSLESFTGEDIGFVSKDTQMSYKSLSENEFSLFLTQLFKKSSTENGYIIVENKAVLYAITDQKLENPEKTEQFKKILSENVLSIKNTELAQDLLKSLQKRYKVEQYYKGSNLE